MSGPKIRRGKEGVFSRPHPMLLALGIAFALVSGCHKNPKVVPISGRVTVEGQPMVDVAVNFAPLTGTLDSAPGASGKTDKDGRYRLVLLDTNQSGALIGRNRVTLHERALGGEPDGATPKATFRLPPQARDGTLFFEVPATGTDAANFEFPASAAHR